MEDPKTARRFKFGVGHTKPQKTHKLWLVAGPFKWEEIRFTKN